MALVLNEEQRLLKDTSKEFLTANAPVEALRQLRDSNDPIGYSKSLWTQMVELGWASIILPEAYDGLDFGFMGLGAIIEESGHTLTASPLFSTVVLGASALILGGNDQQKQQHLPAVAAGSLTLTLALEETNHHNPSHVALTAAADGANYVLNGDKVLVLDGHTADKIIVTARTSGTTEDANGITLFLLDANSAGVEITQTKMIDSRNAANIRFNNVAVAADAIIGTIDKGFDILEPVLDRGRVCLAAEMLGGAQECFDRTVAYLKEREQFGVKIGSFQALKHRAAIMFTELELSKSVVLDALSAIDENRPGANQVASLAKARLNDVYKLVTNEAVQMHGGIGVTDELEIGFFLKRARVAMQLLGDSGFHKDRYATLAGY
ncbi:acyl-CoA dehydrogenase family protein [Oceanicoccus sp. KOV_DT_Chl]|uniref:acyl-CoA dehydrogenase family protein n=1 Tax=Oceanicoccus sp. KOV_DT_Chl TaxID=1904639 RepID=UPI000C7C914F|nr:acyl-CoA dehydrogenase family protein [Oceanicoccus sp. KOV_DT_Chl]